MDFKEWYKIGCTKLPDGDCPTLFPLPPLYPGSADANTDTLLPKHVHKAGGGPTQVQVGTWEDHGDPGPTSSSTIAGSWTQQGKAMSLDNGKAHASKDFWDPGTVDVYSSV
jgi:hypothetical protein